MLGHAIAVIMVRSFLLFWQKNCAAEVWILSAEWHLELTGKHIEVLWLSDPGWETRGKKGRMEPGFQVLPMQFWDVVQMYVIREPIMIYINRLTELFRNLRLEHSLWLRIFP